METNLIKLLITDNNKDTLINYFKNHTTAIKNIILDHEFTYSDDKI